MFRDGDRIRMYYVAADLISADGTQMASRPIFACYAENQDAIHWVKPELGLFEFGGSKRNNIVWSGPKLDNFTPFRDPNPECRPGERYKAVAYGPGGLWAYQSDDGLHWSTSPFSRHRLPRHRLSLYRPPRSSTPPAEERRQDCFAKT
ncbi:MAG: hypothetical protein NTY19_19980 [Planctomycetota bacterium]|nr:hypothetical protein [Planctomycetota bacterium]